MANPDTILNAKNPTKVGVIGLGSMGYGMAQSLLRAGFETYGFDIDPARIASLAEEGGRAGLTADLNGALDALVIVVVNAQQMNDTLFGAGAVLPALRKGGLVIGCPTVSPDAARQFEDELKSLGYHYLDAPISGGAVKAADGALTVMMSGSAEVINSARPLLDAMAETIFELGDKAGPASAMKVVNQLLAGVHIAAAAEAITFAQTQGIAPALTVDVISKCAGTSWMFENRGPHIVDGDYTPRSAVDIFIKDLSIVADTARNNSSQVPLASTALTQFVAANKMGLGREDDAAVAKVYARAANIKLPGED